ncbi:MAG: deoxyguanosinetriphosphate triphosphohydrolase [Clostridia bacterium]|nr:deoxyguanosinetriphosphate triphosphohydrolase [Clostridia bacterium]MBR1685991.1 deoxyguanosinetriphosphate triphosphohydrolase [Clostridia bacterium]
MSLREEREALEHEVLSPLACFADSSQGRAQPLEEDPIRTCFQRDRDRIIHCKAFRRLEGKTQVFLAPEGDHYRTRLTHTLEVSQVARTLARGLHLNEDLTEAIALGHDLGHTPFGHIGERALDDVLPGGFRHNEQSLRVVDTLENGGNGLNLTFEVRDGIRCHSGSDRPSTLEGQCVRYADRIAYLNHDLDDALRGNVLKPFELPADILRVLGKTHSERIATMVGDLIETSQGQSQVSMTPLVQSAMDGLREFMFEKVYHDSWRAAQEDRCHHIMHEMFAWYLEHPGEMPEEYLLICYREGTERGVCDFLSGMTDRYCIRTYCELFVPKGFSVM